MSIREFLNLPTFLVIIYIVIFCVCLLGLLGNILTVVVLTKIKWKKPVIILFLSLVFCHSLELLHQLYSNILTHSFLTDRFAMQILTLAPFSLTMQSFANMGATCFTVLLSAERYLNLSRPLQARLLFTTRSVCYAVLVVAGLSVLLAIPTLYEHEVVRIRIFDEILASMNLTIDVLNLEGLDMPEELIYISKAPASTEYFYAMITLHILTQVVLPWLALAAFTGLTYLQIQKLNRAGAGEMLNEEQENDISMTKSVMYMVLIYFTSNLIVLYSYFEILIRNNAEESLNQLSLLARFNEFFIVLTAAANFIILMCVTKRFRNTFLNLFSQITCLRRCLSLGRDDQRTLVVHMENTGGSTISFRTLTNEVEVP